jgi:sugar/nucleoside kinase (ribokinase family)
MALARAAAIPVSIDLNLRAGIVDGTLSPEYARALWDAVTLADYVFGSVQDEMTLLAPAASEAEALRLLAGDERTVIARSGAGATIVSAGRGTTVPAFRVPVVDTLGAGDVFNAGFIAARIEGKPCAEAACWGNAAAALKIGRRGARGAPSRAELDTLLEQADVASVEVPVGTGEGGCR